VTSPDSTPCCGANDYPHHEGSFPFSAEWIEKQFDGVPAAEVDQICRGNAAEIFGIKV